MKLLFAAALLIAGGFSAVPAQQPGSRRTDLQRHDLSTPGREVVQVRVDLDPGSSFPRHTHFGEEIIYVIEGKLEYRIGDQPAVVVKPGDVLFVPAGVVHSVKNIGTGNGAELATYIVEKDKPLVSLVDGPAAPPPAVYRPPEVQKMIVTSIQYTFAAKDADKAEALLRELREATLREPGVVRFDVARSTDDPNVFALWEEYRDKAAFDAHRAAEQFTRLVVNGIRPLAGQRVAVNAAPISNE
jgi:quercetin dioxygenase-like cupin family protein/quinol monooxygenase YgiN